MKRTLLLTAGNASFSFSQLAMLFAIGHKLGAASLGEYNFAIGLVTPIAIFLTLNLRSIVATDSKALLHAAAYWRLRLLSVTVFAGLSCGLFLLHGSAGSRIAGLIAFLGVAKLCDLCSDLVYGFLQSHERIGSVAISRFVVSIVQLGGAAVLLNAEALPSGVEGLRLVAMFVAGGSMAALFANDVPAYFRLMRSANPDPDFGLSVKEILTLGVGGAIAAGFDSLLVVLPRYIIQAKISFVEVGVYSASSALLMVGGVFISALVNSFSAQIGRAWQDGTWKVLLVRLCAISLVPAGGILAVGLFTGSLIGELLFGKDFGSISDLVAWTGLVSLVWYPSVVVSMFLIAARALRLLALASVLSAGVVIGVSVWLVPVLGWRAGMLALTAAYALRGVLGLWMLAKGATVRGNLGTSS